MFGLVKKKRFGLSMEKNEFLEIKENCEQRIDAEDNGGYQLKLLLISCKN
jgi:hypothetical protein